MDTDWTQEIKKGPTLSRKAFLKIWCAQQDSNLRPLPSESTATVRL